MHKASIVQWTVQCLMLPNIFVCENHSIFVIKYKDNLPYVFIEMLTLTLEAGFGYPQ